MTLSKAICSSVGQKSIMALTGTLLALFLLVHALGNATSFLGREAFNSYADKLHSLGCLITVFEILLLSLFLLHIFLATILFLQNTKARPSRYSVNRASGGRTIGSRTMPYTGLIILLFVIIHLWNFHFTEHSVSIAELVKSVLSQPLFAFFYIISIIALALHISHGFWSLFQSLGINHPKYNSFLRKGTLVAALVLSAVYIFIPALSMTWDRFLM